MVFQRRQLQHLGIDFERLPACRISGDEDPLYLQHYNNWNRPLSPSEVSCFFSHKNAWDIVIKENSPMLILEDDALLDETISGLLEALEVFDNLDYVCLEARGNHQKKCLAKESSATICDASLLRLYQGRSGAAAYVLWPSGAQKLINQMSHKGIGIADKFINLNYSLLAYQIEPAPAIQLDQCRHYGLKTPLQVSTSITNARLAKDSNRLTYLKYRYRRLLAELTTGINQLSHLHHANRRAITVSDHFYRPQ